MTTSQAPDRTHRAFLHLSPKSLFAEVITRSRLSQTCQAISPNRIRERVTWIAVHWLGAVEKNLCLQWYISGWNHKRHKGPAEDNLEQGRTWVAPATCCRCPKDKRQKLTVHWSNHQPADLTSCLRHG
jgi:hypothetical protein